MEIDNKHIAWKVWASLCQFLLGAAFIFSGFVKAVDPFGFFYKIQDYLAAFGLISKFPFYLPLWLGIV
ncbi:MAG: DoxX family protein, partial [Bacteroides sp.]|nr:DoxX family protein [Bacteroides sp.]